MECGNTFPLGFRYNGSREFREPADILIWALGHFDEILSGLFYWHFDDFHDYLSRTADFPRTLSPDVYLDESPVVI